jgi:hypothetical protein
MNESCPSDFIRIKVEFPKSFAATKTAEFTFKPESNQPAVTWSMAGKNNFIARAVYLFINMDKPVGGDFEKGLARMKSVVEAAPILHPDSFIWEGSLRNARSTI